MATSSLNQIFAALGDPTRRAIVARLASGKATVSELAAPFTISLPAIPRHLKVLERAELIVRIPDGHHRWCQLNPSAIREASDWLAYHQRFWNESFDRLDSHLRPTHEPTTRLLEDDP